MSKKYHIQKSPFIVPTTDDKIIVLSAGESIKIEKGTRVQYSNPFDVQCEYLSVCMPAFSIDLVNREE